MKFFNWLSGIFQDQNGTASSKRIALFVGLFYLYMLVNGSLNGKIVNEEVLFTIGGIILFCIGAVTSEFFSNKSNDKQ